MIKVGDYILLSEEVRLADQILKVICGTDEECLIDYIKDVRVGFKLCWKYGMGWCTLQQAEEMHLAWADRNLPALRGGPDKESES